MIIFVLLKRKLRNKRLSDLPKVRGCEVKDSGVRPKLLDLDPMPQITTLYH